MSSVFQYLQEYCVIALIWEITVFHNGRVTFPSVPAFSTDHCVFCQLSRDTKETFCDCSHESRIDTHVDEDMYLILWQLLELIYKCACIFELHRGSASSGLCILFTQGCLSVCLPYLQQVNHSQFQHLVAVVRH